MPKAPTQRASRRRPGAAVVEFAVCLPLLMLIVLGTIEATHGIFLKQTLTAAAYEGIREAVDSRSSSADAINRAEAILLDRQVRGFSVRLSPSDTGATPRSQPVTIEVSAPISMNSPFIGRVVQDRIITVRSVMIKE